MNTSLTIKKFGPVEEIEIDLNRLNVFIGPQSSGKSSIAKVISFCQWLEKDCVKRQRTGHVDREFAEQLFVIYHNVADYISDETYFRYRSDVLSIEYTRRELKVKRGPGFKNALVSKNAYIPSERNLISVPGIFTTKMPYNYIKSFLSDWQQIRVRYNRENPTGIGPLQDSYYFDEGTEADMLRLDNGKSLHLSQASSGMQSVTPLAVYVNYLTDWIYSHPEEQSAEESRNLEEAALAKVIESKATETDYEGFLEYIEDEQTPPDVKNSFREILESISEARLLTPDTATGMMKEILQTRQTLSRPAFSNLVIEEPEQNLFPETQRRLVEHILGNMNHERDRVVLTTHSPFVLYSINNCMIGYLASQEDPEGAKEMTDIPETCFMNPADVSVWELRDGHIRNIRGEDNATIQDERGLIRDNYFDRVMGNVMTDFRNLNGML